MKEEIKMVQKIGFGLNNKQVADVFAGVAKSPESQWILSHQLSGQELKAAIAKIEAKRAGVVPAGSAVNLDRQA